MGATAPEQTLHCLRESATRDPDPTWALALVVVRDRDRVLLVRDPGIAGWALPAGRIERGEPLIEAACREALLATGVAIEIDGLLRVEHAPLEGCDASRLRVIFTARPLAATRTRVTHQAAAWLTLDDLDLLALRREELCDLVAALLGRGPDCAAPLAVDRLP